MPGTEEHELSAYAWCFVHERRAIWWNTDFMIPPRYDIPPPFFAPTTHENYKKLLDTRLVDMFPVNAQNYNFIEVQEEVGGRRVVAELKYFLLTLRWNKGERCA